MQAEYLAYMLRLWQIEENGHPAWRASLEKPGTEERHSFTSIYALFTFLEQQTNQTNQTSQTSQTRNYTFQHHIVEKKENEDTSIEIRITLKSPKHGSNQEK